MDNNKESAMKDLSNLMNATSSLMSSLLRDDKDSIRYWNESIKSWENYLNKKISRILEEIEKKEENILEEEKING